VKTFTLAEFRSAAALDEETAIEFLVYWVEAGVLEVVADGSDGMPCLLRLSARGWRICGELLGEKPEVEDASDFARERVRS
jgi:hypothetical protein